MNPFSLRVATLSDVPVLVDLIATSVRGLSADDYTAEQIEAAIGTAWGLDTQLVRDGTYFVAEALGEIVGCGGWSRRRTLFGGDAQQGRDSDLLDPSHQPAKVRAFFTRPDWARNGVGRALLQRCESEAQAAGFFSVELLATLPGTRLYCAHGYVGETKVEHMLPGGLPINFVPMRKKLPLASSTA